MIPKLRKDMLLHTLNETGVVNIQDAMKQFNVSDLTIRRDLIEFESQGILTRTRGGAIKSKVTDVLFTYDTKINQNRQNKEDICHVATGYLHEDDIIFVDCGTTLSLFAKHISKFKRLTVITTSLPVISELMNFQNIRLSLIGGDMDVERQAIYGTVAESYIGMYHAHKAFIGTDGISLKKGLSSYDDQEGAITLRMMENSDEVFLLCDSSKIEKNSFVRFASIDKINHLITDRHISPVHLRMYQDAGVDVITESQENDQNIQFNINHNNNYNSNQYVKRLVEK